MSSASTDPFLWGRREAASLLARFYSDISAHVSHVAHSTRVVGGGTVNGMISAVIPYHVCPCTVWA